MNNLIHLFAVILDLAEVGNLTMDRVAQYQKLLDKLELEGRDVSDAELGEARTYREEARKRLEDSV